MKNQVVLLLQNIITLKSMCFLLFQICFCRILLVTQFFGHKIFVQYSSDFAIFSFFFLFHLLMQCVHTPYISVYNLYVLCIYLLYRGFQYILTSKESEKQQNNFTFAKCINKKSLVFNLKKYINGLPCAFVLYSLSSYVGTHTI